MNPGARPQEREAVDDLEAELGALGAMLRATPLPEPPPSCDAAILAAAQEAARRKRYGGGRWSGVLAAAATLSLAIGIGWHSARDPQVAALPTGERAAAAPAAPEPDRGALQVEPVPTPRSARAMAPTLTAAAVSGAENAETGADATDAAAAGAADAGARPDPAAWLARIDALRRAGRADEAAREETLLDATWPGWRAAATPGR